MTPETVGEQVARFEDHGWKPIGDGALADWIDAFRDVPDDIAVAAFTAAIQGAAHQPRIHDVMGYVPAARQAVEAIHLRDGSTRPGVCTRCLGYGWLRGPNVAGRTFPSVRYETARPCTCDRVRYDRWQEWCRLETVRQQIRDGDLHLIHPDRSKAHVQDLRGFLRDVATGKALTAPEGDGQ